MGGTRRDHIGIASHQLNIVLTILHMHGGAGDHVQEFLAGMIMAWNGRVWRNNDV